jgi:hypothetical protein
MGSRRFVALFGVLLFALIATSRPQRVGDAREYIAMAMNLARLKPPALSRTDMLLAERRLDEWHFGGLPLAYFNQLTDSRGRQDFFHFWFYPALAVPGIWVASITGMHPNYAFVALNALLSLGALWVVSRRLTWWLSAAVFLSPVLWWIDKSHTEAFTFSLLAIAFALLLDAPWWSMIALGAAATQNPPIALLLVLVGAALLIVRPGAWRDRRFLAGTLAGGLLAALHPIYYEWRWRLPTPQIVLGTEARVPTIQELGAVLWDPNLGLLFNAPLLVLTVVVAAVLVARRARSRLVDADVWLALAGAGIFLLSFAQTTNINSGATPGLSRYAVWLIPLSIPILRRASGVTSEAAPRWFVLVALASCALSIAAYHPRRPENYTTPTPAARFLWAWWPSIDDPLPEVFAERVSGEEPGLVPIATPDCAKVLVSDGRWPVPCAPQAVPEPCGVPNALCYANRTRSGYAFVPVEALARYPFERHQVWTWTAASMADVERILGRVSWRNLRWIRQSAPGAKVRASRELSWTYGLQSDEALVVYVAGPRQGASLTLSLAGSMSGWWMNPGTGEVTAPVRVEPAGRALVPLEIPAGRAAVLVLRRDR